MNSVREQTSDVSRIIVPVFATVDEYCNIKTDNIRQYAQFLKDKGMDGVVVGSTTGEGPSLSLKDKKLLIDAWVAACNPLGLTVVAVVGGTPLPDAVDLAAYAGTAGVNAIFVIAELYYKARNPRELVYNIQVIAKAAPDTAIIYDDNPDYTGVKVNIVKFLEQATECISNFKGIKTNVFKNALELQDKLNGDQKIYIADEIYLEVAIRNDFNNFVLSASNVLPELTREIVRNAQMGNLKKSKAQLRRYIDLIGIITEQGNSLAALKTAMTMVTGIQVGDILPPQIPLTDEQQCSLEVRLRENNVELAHNSDKGIESD